MAVYHAIIIDDEKNVREALKLLLAKHCPEIDILGMATSAAEGRQLILEHSVDFIFLDISMPGEDGFGFLSSVASENYGIIFTTAHQEFALSALKANAIDYLLKPIDPAELTVAVSQAIRMHNIRRSSLDALNYYKDSLENLKSHVHAESLRHKEIMVADAFGFRMINLNDLIYLESNGNQFDLHLNSDETITTRLTLGDFEQILNCPQFTRIHRSTIINLAYVKTYANFLGYYAEMTNGTRLKISAKKVEEFRNAFEKTSNTRH
jgi:two-component system LytT family response regulator